MGGGAMRVFLLLVDEPFYTAGCLEPLLDRWGRTIVGAAFPPGFFDWKRAWASLRVYGPAGMLSRTLTLGLAAARGGAVHRQLAARHIPVVDAPSVNAPPFLETLRQLDVSLVVSLNCPQKLERPILSLPAQGCINVHFGKLPRYRGLMPVFHALLNGDPSFGVTVHLMDEKLDNGDIVAQTDVPIVAGDTLETLYPRGFSAASRLLDQALDAFESGHVILRPNPESERTYYTYPTADQIRAYRQLVRQ
jgi:methionyl-tRNA formyltransferase